MAVPGVSPRDPDPVRAVTKGRQKELGADSSGAGNANNPDIVRVLQTADTGQIGRAIGAPVTEEGRYLGFPIVHV